MHKGTGAQKKKEKKKKEKKKKKKRKRKKKEEKKKKVQRKIGAKIDRFSRGGVRSNQESVSNS